MQKDSTLTVGLGTRAYDIHVGRGLIGRADDILGDMLADRHVVIISDAVVAPLIWHRWKRPADVSAAALTI